MTSSSSPVSVGTLIRAIRRLPSDEPLMDREHWLGWLGEYHAQARTAERLLRNVTLSTTYNHTVEPKMLLWLIAAAGVESNIVKTARLAAGRVSMFPGKSASIRRHVPWSIVVTALRGRRRLTRHAGGAEER